jgi:hypothetical protein
MRLEGLLNWVPLGKRHLPGRSRLPGGTPWDAWTKAAVGIWLLVTVIVCVRGAVQPGMHSLYPTYARAGREWLTRGIVYHAHWAPPYDQYRYSPVVTVLLVPFHLLPDVLGSVLWRLLNGGVFLAGFAWFLHAAAPVHLSQRQHAILSLLALPLALTSLNNGQPNLLVMGLLLAAVAGIARDRWNVAALCVGLGCAVKIYPIAIGLLLAAMYPRRFALRLVLAIVLLAALPFLFQAPDFVADQYAAWYERLGDNDRKYWPLNEAYRDLWLLFRVARVPITPAVYLGIQLAAAAGCALVCVAGRWRGLARPEALLPVLTLGTSWMMLCGPATESCTYSMFAPVLAWAVLSARLQRWPRGVRLLPAAGLVLFVISLLAGLIPVPGGTARVHGLGLQPLGTLLVAAGFVVIHLQALSRPSAPSGSKDRGERTWAA